MRARLLTYVVPPPREVSSLAFSELNAEYAAAFRSNQNGFQNPIWRCVRHARDLVGPQHVSGVDHAQQARAIQTWFPWKRLPHPGRLRVRQCLHRMRSEAPRGKRHGNSCGLRELLRKQREELNRIALTCLS